MLFVIVCVFVRVRRAWWQLGFSAWARLRPPEFEPHSIVNTFSGNKLGVTDSFQIYSIWFIKYLMKTVISFGSHM
jgi:hypothetical protein